MDLCDLSAAQITRLIHSREVSASEVLESTLARIAKVDGRPGTLDPGPITSGDEQQLHAFITQTIERARAQAAEVDRKLAAGDDPGPLATGAAVLFYLGRGGVSDDSLWWLIN